MDGFAQPYTLSLYEVEENALNTNNETEKTIYLNAKSDVLLHIDDPRKFHFFVLFGSFQIQEKVKSSSNKIGTIKLLHLSYRFNLNSEDLIRL